MSARPRFTEFYHNHYLPEHQKLPNIILHAAGTVGGIMVLLAVIAQWIGPWWLLAFPVAHASPGLLGHRLFERNKEVGDARITRTDFPPIWFMLANHLYLWRLLTGRNG